MIANYFTNKGGKVRIERKRGQNVISTNLWGSYYLITDPNAIRDLENLMACGENATAVMFDNVKNAYNVNSIGVPDPGRGRNGYNAPATSSASSAPAQPAQSAQPAQPAQSSATSSAPAEGMESATSEEAPSEPAPEPEAPAPEASEIEALKISIAERILKLLNRDEFVITPSARFVNTLANRVAYSGKAGAKEYFAQYFTLSDHPDKDRIIPLADSMEFASIIDDIEKVPVGKTINNRLEIYYGAPGTGKTTEAKAMYPSAKVMICSKEMTSDNLFRRFEFNDVNGNPVFRQTALVDAMEAGEPIILDEINLLPWSSIQDLQALTDNKEEPYIEALKKSVKVKQGFKIIGTMNLQINGQTYGLSEALVDRAGVLKEFGMNANQLAGWAW